MAVAPWPATAFESERWDERRRGRRYPCPAHVAVGSQWVVGRDIGRGGISVYMRDPLPVGHLTVVSLARQTPNVTPLTSAARVVRCELNQLGFLVALQFLSDGPRA